MRRSVLLVALLVSLLAFAAPGAAKGPRRDGSVTGAIRLCGGPAPGGCFTQNGTVKAKNSKGVVVASQQTKHGRFSFELRPGSYTLEARTGGGVHGKETVVVRLDKTTKANIVIPIP
jgi:hypothetical protein